MPKFEKGTSGNSRGRPRNSLSKKNPQRVIQEAISHGMGMKQLKLLAIDLLDPQKTKLSEAQTLSLFKTLLDTEVKLTELYLKYGEKEEEKDVTPKEDDSPIFSLKAVET